MLNNLKENGANIIEIKIPHLKQMRVAHSTIISSEMAFIHDIDYNNEYLEIPTIFGLGVGRTFSALEFIASNKLKGWARR